MGKPGKANGRVEWQLSYFYTVSKLDATEANMRTIWRIIISYSSMEHRKGPIRETRLLGWFTIYMYTIAFWKRWRQTNRRSCSGLCTPAWRRMASNAPNMYKTWLTAVIMNVNNEPIWFAARVCVCVRVCLPISIEYYVLTIVWTEINITKIRLCIAHSENYIRIWHYKVRRRISSADR